MQRVAVFGAGGRMGRTVCAAVTEDPDMELVAAVDPEYAGIDLRQVTGADGSGVQIAKGPDEILRAGAEVAVDFTVADAARKNMGWCADHGVHAVVGTSGLSEREIDELTAVFGASAANCVVAANFAIGAVLMARFTELAAPFMDGLEIIELHHNQKIDAPSGTALQTAKLAVEARAKVSEVEF
jgi:4-hydroxy-tetrahydrodipicolinate reductase